MTLAEEFARDGFVVIPNALSGVEVARLRADATRALDRWSVPFALGTTAPNAAIESPEIEWVFAHATIVGAVRAALDRQDVMFTLEANVQRNATSAWHKDTGVSHMPGGYYGCDDPFGRDDCRVLKVGIYLQAHDDGRGLRVRRGSHKLAALDQGDEVVLRTSTGDLVLFDVCLTHSGQVPERDDRAVVKAARYLPHTVRPRAVAGARRAINRVRRRPDRIAVFFAFGPSVPMTETYGRRNLAREHDQTGRAGSEVKPSLARAFASQGVELMTVS